MAAIGIFAGLVVVVGASQAAAAAEIPSSGDTVWVGPKHGYGGTGLYAVYLDTPADPDAPGTPDFWSYCLEQPVTAETHVPGYVGDLSSYLGVNYFADDGIPGKVLWVLAHSYPALSLEEFAAAAGVPGLSEFDAIEATQYAIWRYTDLNFDAAWPWETEDSEDAYWYLVNGANASSGLTPADFETTVDIVGPTIPQTAGALVGPFEVSTNQPTAVVEADPSFSVVDGSGIALDTSAVTDGQEIYLDVRDVASAGSATVTASVFGSSGTGLVISVPTIEGGEPTEQDHAQSMILVTPSTTTTDAQASVSWTAPELARTGVEIIVPIGAGVALVLAGLALTVIRRASAP